MKNPLHTVLCFLALACMSAQPILAGEWQTTTHQDPITDETSWAVGTAGTVVEKLTRERPALVIVYQDPFKDSGTLRYTARVQITSSAFDHKFMENTTPIIFRFDSEPAQTEMWALSEDGRAASPNQDWSDLIRTHKKLVIRYRRLLGGTTTSSFDLEGFSAAYDKIYAQMSAVAVEKAPPVETTQPAAPACDPKLVAQATSAMNDITRALDYAKKPDGTPPRMQTATSLNKPLTAIGRAVSKNISLQNTCQNLEKKFSRSRPGSIGRPTPEQLDRARANAAQSKNNLNDAVFELRRQARSILQTSDWPTPELSAQAKAISARIPTH